MRPALIPLLLLSGVLLLELDCRKVKPDPDSGSNSEDSDAGRKRREEDARKRAEAEARMRAEHEARLKQEAIEQAQIAVQKEQWRIFQQAAEAALRDIHFDYDRAEIREQDKVILQNIADFMKAHPEVELRIEGHCDERGTAEYNIALSTQRAVSTLDFLTALGVAKGRLQIVGLGKEAPLCTEPSETCWTRNRRAHFVLKNQGKLSNAHRPAVGKCPRMDPANGPNANA